MNRTTIHPALSGFALGLAAALSSACRVAAPSLEREVTLISAGGTNPTTAVANGAVYVAWVGVDSGTSNVFVARMDSAGASARTRVNDVVGDAAPHLQAPPQLAAGPGGMLYIAWQATRPTEGLMFGAADVRLARSRDGGRTWDRAVSVNDDAGRLAARHTFHDIAVGGDGTVYVSWIDARHRDSLRVALAKAGKGGHHHGGTEPGTDIRIAASRDQGHTFSSGVVIDSNSCPCCRTAIAVGPDGAVYVTWRKIEPGDVRDIVVARSGDGGLTFERPVKVHEDGWVFAGCPHAGPDIVVDSMNTIHMTWYTGASGREGLYYAASRDGGRHFDNPEALVTGVTVSQARLALTGPDAVWITWEDRSAEKPRLALARASSSGLRRYPEMLFEGEAPALAAAGSQVAVAWLDGETVKARTSR